MEKILQYDKLKLKAYIQDLIQKLPQVIVQSRFGVKKQNESLSSRGKKKVYEISIADNLEIEEKFNIACSSIDPLKEFCFTVEILLKTPDGPPLTLEVWNICQDFSDQFRNPFLKTFTDLEVVFSNLLILLKSVISVTRILPAFKLSFQQSSHSHVLLYNIYSGKPEIRKLGENPQVNKIGEVFTPLGVISVTVSYRLRPDIIIAPQNADKENALVLKTNHFNLSKSPTKANMSESEATKSETNIGAFAPSSTLPDAVFPELEFLRKPFLNMSRAYAHCKERSAYSNPKSEPNLNALNDSIQINVVNGNGEIDCSRLSCSQTSDNDFVLVDMKKPSFACHSCNYQLGEFFQEWERAPELFSFSRASLEEQLLEASGQLEKYEAYLNEYDDFVDSVCQKSIQSL